MAEKIELDVDLASVRDELKQMQTELQKTGAEGTTVFKDLVTDAQAMAKAQREVTEEIEQTTAATKRADQATGSFGSRVKSAILDFNIAGKSLAEWGQQGRGLLSFLGAGEGAVGRFGGAFKVLGNIIKLSPIGLLAGVVAALIGYFTRFQSGIDKVSQVMSGVSAVVNVLIERFLKLGSALVNVFKGDFVAAANDVKGAVGGIGDELVRAATEAAALEKRFQELRDASRTASVEASRLKIELEKAKQIADDTNQSYSRRIAAAQKAAEIERKLADTALDFAAERLAAEQEYFAQNKESGDARDRLAQAEIEFSNAQIERNNVLFSGEQAIKSIRKEAAEESKKRAAEAKKERDDLLKDLEKLRVAVQPPGSEDRAVAEVEKKYADLIAVAEKNIAKLNAIEQKGALNPEQIAQREEFKNIIVALKSQELDEIANVLTEFTQKELDLEDARQREIEAKRRKDIEAQRQAVEDIRDIRESEIDITEQNFRNYIRVLEANGASREEIARQQMIFDKIIQEERIKNFIESQEKLLALTDEGDTATIELIKNKILKAKAELEGLSVPDPEQPGGNDGPFSLGSLLGLRGGELEDFEKAVEIVKQGLREISQARAEAARAAVQAAEEEVRASQDKVENAEDDLERELELARLGFASDVTNAQERLKRAQQEENEAKVRREKALQDQKKQQRSQILLDSVLQASNMITAATNVYKGFSVIPFVGQILGAAAVAILIGSFIGAKAKALQATKAKHGIQGRVGKTGIVEGPSHEGGGVPLEVEGGEFVYQDGKRISVVKKSATNDHFGLLQAINEDDRPMMAHYLRKLTGGISRDQSIGARPSSSGSSGSIRLSDKETHTLLRENNELQRKLLAMEEERESVYDMGDYLLIKKRGRSERLQKRKTK